MNIIICENHRETSRRAAKEVMKDIILNPSLHLGLATGSSPVSLYKNLIEGYRKDIVSFKRVKTFNLDEYLGLEPTHPQSYHSFMHEHLFQHIDLPKENIHIINGASGEGDKIAAEFNTFVKKHKIDVQILGIGGNGHIGFNEPGTPFSNETFVVELNEQTRIDNSRFFPSLDDVPTHAVTMGIKNIMQSRKIILLAQGKHKAEAVRQMIEGDVTPEHPASVLQLHPEVTVLLDQEAASLLTTSLKD